MPNLTPIPDGPMLTEDSYPKADVPIYYSRYAAAGRLEPIIGKLNAKIVELANGRGDARTHARDQHGRSGATTGAKLAYLEEDAACTVEPIDASDMKLQLGDLLSLDLATCRGKPVAVFAQTQNGPRPNLHWRRWYRPRRARCRQFRSGF